MKNKGFTLIELLAVITITGILSLVGIPTVNGIIENARKDNYINTAKKYANKVQELWVTDQLYCGSDNTSSAAVEDGDYYILIDSSNYDLYSDLLEQGGKSSWGDRDVKGYVRVNVKLNPSTDKQEVRYYVALSDKIHGIYDEKGNEVEADELVRGDLVMSLDDESIEEIEVYPFENGNVTTCSENAFGNTTGAAESVITILTGDKDTIGSQVQIGTEIFYVYGHEGDNVKLFAKTNLYVGGQYDWSRKRWNPYGEAATGIQNSKMRGVHDVAKPYEGVCPFTSDIDTYLNNYKSYLTNYGVTINNVRLISLSELEVLGCDLSIKKCTNAPKFVYEFQNDLGSGTITYWIGDRESAEYVYALSPYKKIVSNYYTFGNGSSGNGVRPVVIVPKTEF